uniref:Neuroparsin-A n=1 Tax=Photinus pyralis TaxID=7054 RepID=A0A1Y1N1P0_PHOPY
MRKPLPRYLISGHELINCYSSRTDARWVCNPCATEDECEREPIEFCMWGEARDSCNRRVCAKGPGERCGGPLGILGQCGDGMMCKKDERCHGCSTQTFQCHP